jgi:hypothetical protein
MNSDIEKSFINLTIGAMLQRLFSSLTLLTNQLERLFLVAFQARSFAGKARAIPIGATSRIGSYPYSIYLTMLTSYKRSILFAGNDSDIEKKFIILTIGSILQSFFLLNWHCQQISWSVCSLKPFKQSHMQVKPEPTRLKQTLG